MQVGDKVYKFHETDPKNVGTVLEKIKTKEVLLCRVAFTKDGKFVSETVEEARLKKAL